MMTIIKLEILLLLKTSVFALICGLQIVYSYTFSWNNENGVDSFITLVTFMSHTNKQIMSAVFPGGCPSGPFLFLLHSPVTFSFLFVCSHFWNIAGWSKGKRTFERTGAWHRWVYSTISSSETITTKTRAGTETKTFQVFHLICNWAS